MKEVIKTLVVTFLFLQIIGIVIGMIAFENCKKVMSPKDIWNKPTKTKKERLLAKPVVLLMSPGIYLGGIIAQPSICNKEEDL